jgi:hypothetical protein
MSQKPKTYMLTVLLLFLTILTFGFILPEGISFDDTIVVVMTFAYLFLIYIPVAAKIGRIILKGFIELYGDKDEAEESL